MMRSRARPRRVVLINRLAAAGCVAAEDEVDDLIAAAPNQSTLEQRVHRREAGEPLAWITGSVQFCGHVLRVSPGVYVPRHQSEELARRAAMRLTLNPGPAADLCTGAGAIAVHLISAVPGAPVVGVDIDRTAAECARSNGVDVVIGDLGESLRSRAFRIVTAVAPYVPTRELAVLPRDVQHFEPRVALDGGVDGLDVIRRVVDSSARLLRPGGTLLFEVGVQQDKALAPILALAGFDAPTVWLDDDGDLRGLEARASKSLR